MKVALISSIINPTAPSGQGGTSVLNYTLATNLRKILKPDDELTVFASAHSKIKPDFYPICQESHLDCATDTKTALGKNASENACFFKAMEHIKNGGFDVVHHSHFNFLPVALSVEMGLKTILTIHVNRDVAFIDNLKLALGKDFEKINFVSISLSHRKIYPDIHFRANVYNGIDLTMFKYNPRVKKDYFCWMGRIAEYKGLKEAAEIAIRTKKKLKFAGPIQNNEYFESVKKEYPSNLVEYIGLADEKKRQELLGGAIAFLFPIKWEEPFGLVMVEAMACGTPVIAFNRGAVEEIVQDGKTGFVCPPNDLQAMSEAAHKIVKIDTSEYISMCKNCRKRVEDYFSANQMAAKYYELYRKL